MTKRLKLKKYLHTLNEVDEIITAMKNLAFIEINKMTKNIKNQANVTRTIHQAGSDFLSFFSDTLPAFENSYSDIYILVGSERGFCGNFNDNVISCWKSDFGSDHVQNTKMIVIGQKLADKLLGDVEPEKLIAGHSVAEEIPETIMTLINELKKLSMEGTKDFVPGNWKIIFNKFEEGQIHAVAIKPLEMLYSQTKTSLAYPPLLNVPAEEFIFEYLNHYLMANFYYVFYESMMAENEKRLQHINNAKSRLENKRQKIFQKINILRQEEITAEIENILLSVKKDFEGF